MKIIVAIDSFKGSLSCKEAGKAVAKGIKRVCAEADVYIYPIADGGEGTLKAIIESAKGKKIELTVNNPLAKPITASYGVIQKTKTAVIEMASAAGLTLISEEERNPLYTTTLGVGEMLRDAIMRGYRDFIIGIGGSATNDGGVGMLSALGFEFLDKNNRPIQAGAIGLKGLSKIKTDNALYQIKDCRFRVACDVKIPLCGKSGASAVFAPQKGATPKMCADMDKWLANYAALTKSVVLHSDENHAGSGAAGGMGFALMSYLKAELLSGIDIVIRETRLEEHIKEADLVVTGEGRLDGQTKMGKVPVGVASLAKKYNKPIIAFCGSASPDATLLHNYGIDAYFPILQTPCTLAQAMSEKNAYANLALTSEQVFRLIKTLKYNK